jgi:hypothetical protein
MKVTSVENPGRGVLWSGTAIDDDGRYEWFATADGSVIDIRKEEPVIPGCWMNVKPGRGDKRAVLGATFLGR